MRTPTRNETDELRPGPAARVFPSKRRGSRGIRHPEPPAVAVAVAGSEEQGVGEAAPARIYGSSSEVLYLT